MLYCCGLSQHVMTEMEECNTTMIETQECPTKTEMQECPTETEMQECPIRAQILPWLKGPK